jgi:hypothetical protein
MSITLEEAITMTTNFRANITSVLAEDVQSVDIVANCETFDKTSFEDFINNPDCTSIRIYYGMDTSSKIHAIIVGVNTSDEDMIPTMTQNYPIKRADARCPTNCPPSSVLNSGE